MADKTVLLVDDDASQRKVIEFWLQEEGYTTLATGDGKAALRILEERSPHLVIADIRMPGMDGLELLSRIRAIDEDTPVILMTAFGTVNNAVEAMKLGAADYLLKPLNSDELKLIVRRALERQDLLDENRSLRKLADAGLRFESLVGCSQKMREVFELALQVSRRDSTVLLTGESGTGKELLARAIHQNSLRVGKPFVTINCGAIPEALVESELFGHRKGSFTGAISDRVGKFEAANEGTVFLDEIAELKPDLQVRLLRVLQEREIDKVGHSQPIKINVRILAATNRDLRKLIEDARFREDLFYRLSVVTIHIPPLRERREDIPLLVDHFLQKWCSRYALRPISITPQALEILACYNWPGNVRELENVIERLAVLNKGEAIQAEHLPPEMRQVKNHVANITLELPDGGISLEDVEKEILVRALEKYKGNQTHAAQYLNITRKTLIYRMEKYGLKPSSSETDTTSPTPAEGN